MSTVLCLLGALSGCAGDDGQPAVAVATTAQSLTNASESATDGAVVALRYGDKLLCTGTLVAPKVVLTAGHCVAFVRPTTAFFGSRLDHPGVEVSIRSAEAHPDFDPTTLANDIATVTLAAPAPSEPVPMLERPLDLQSLGAAIRFVGFGRTSPTDVSAPTKRTGTAFVDAIGDTTFEYQSAPSHPCFGDSGGPAFVTQDREYVAGVTSGGNLSCTGSGVQTRVDRYVDSWVRWQIEGANDELGPSQCSIGNRPASLHSSFLLSAALVALTRLRSSQRRAARSASSPTRD